ncbi:Cwf15-Cwc15 cell cycle control protein [Blumeria graminis f. sp. tritici 96224]|uniref:Cwf15-Cwc15 cell cycle control protein n=2 Tax=Blumeria graminis f. sp. tritici 96224 TaxID=1268274 RepID=A0A656KG82_BLUGR|nr:Cwf15-Cwc15 cell cycle control protein [Blumeria graminis f. sp. tritici 96224]
MNKFGLGHMIGVEPIMLRPSRYAQPGQGGDADLKTRDLRHELLQAEAAHISKIHGQTLPPSEGHKTGDSKLLLEQRSTGEDGESETKRRRILEETRQIDAESSSDDVADDSSDDNSDDDETAELQRELEKIKRERAARREQEEQEKAAKDQEKRERDIALGNPLLNTKSDFNVKRRWDDDVIFKNQARGTENKGKKEFVNDLLRSDFHKRFMR